MQGKFAVVTGGGSGIGQAVALGLAREGCVVFAAGRNLAALEETARAADASGGRIIAVPTDVRDEAAVQALFGRVKDEAGRLDLLFNNAGVNAPPVGLEDLALDEWKQVVDTNLTGAFLCTREAMRLMKDQRPQGGRIINNGSISAHAPRPNSGAYTATKHAITGLTRSTSLDGRKYDIACGQIDIGNAATQMTERISQGALQADGSFAAEPRIDLADVVRGVLYMASLPLDANVQFMTIMATKMPYIGRG